MKIKSNLINIHLRYRIKPKLDELGSLHARHLLRPSLDDKCEEEELIENLSQHISKLISSTHRHIQYIRSSLGQGKQCFFRSRIEMITFVQFQAINWSKD